MENSRTGTVTPSAKYGECSPVGIGDEERAVSGGGGNGEEVPDVVMVVQYRYGGGPRSLWQISYISFFQKLKMISA